MVKLPVGSCIADQLPGASYQSSNGLAHPIFRPGLPAALRRQCNFGCLLGYPQKMAGAATAYLYFLRMAYNGE